MKFKVGDLVSRISHNHDIVFRIISIDQQNVFLKGVDLRLYADADIDDLTIVNNVLNDDDSIIFSGQIAVFVLTKLFALFIIKLLDDLS